jgi:uncharacterized protein YdaL
VLSWEHDIHLDVCIVVLGGNGGRCHFFICPLQNFMSETNDEKTKRWFYYGYNRDETIDALMEKLNEREARIAALENELTDLKINHAPSFITQSTFLGKTAS